MTDQSHAVRQFLVSQTENDLIHILTIVRKHTHGDRSVPIILVNLVPCTGLKVAKTELAFDVFSRLWHVLHFVVEKLTICDNFAGHCSTSYHKKNRAAKKPALFSMFTISENKE